MKQEEITACAVCRRGVAHDRNLTFYRVRVEYLVLNVQAIQRQHGLEQFFGGGQAAARIAHVMGPGEDIAKGLSEDTGLVCFDCAVTTSIVHLGEIFGKRAEEINSSEALAPSET